MRLLGRDMKYSFEGFSQEKVAVVLLQCEAIFLFNISRTYWKLHLFYQDDWAFSFHLISWISFGLFKLCKCFNCTNVLGISQCKIKIKHLRLIIDPTIVHTIIHFETATTDKASPDRELRTWWRLWTQIFSSSTNNIDLFFPHILTAQRKKIQCHSQNIETQLCQLDITWKPNKSFEIQTLFH